MKKRQRKKLLKFYEAAATQMIARAQHVMNQPQTRAMLQDMFRAHVASGKLVIASTPSVYNEEFLLPFTLDDHGVTCDAPTKSS